jgi:predicted polyphosphate/ATP-dependent NAD kinase
VFYLTKRIGIIVNPIAGIGGRVGLKGSDGEEILARALCLGAKPECPQKAEIAINRLKEFKKEPLEIITFPGLMGEDEVRASGFEPVVTGEIDPDRTAPSDTINAAREMRRLGVDLVLFAGGDGTARNVLDAVGEDIAALGIPGGCKIHSAVYAINPKTAGDLAVEYLEGRVQGLKESEVMDIDEDLFREGIVNARLYGYLRVPDESKMVQNLKSGRGYGGDAALDLVSRYVAFNMVEDVLYIMGPGSTIRGVMNRLGLKNTLLGVDLVCNNQVVANDVNESEILAALDRYRDTKIIITVIGGQGYLFGRGNQQLSPEVIRRVGKQNIVVIATKNKMHSLFGQPLLVDTGNDALNEELSGYLQVVVGYGESVMFKVQG